MADVFISYARIERPRAEAVKAALEALGLSVFLDVEGLDAGDVFPDILDREVKAAGVVVGLWSPYALSRNWIKTECLIGKDRKVLIPATIVPVSALDIPIAFYGLQIEDLTNFDGDISDANWMKFVRSVGRTLNRSDIVKNNKEEAKSIRNASSKRRRTVIRRREDSEALLHFRMLSRIPKIHSGDMAELPPGRQNTFGYLYERPMSKFTESIRILRSELSLLRELSGSPVISVVSAWSGEGKSTIAACLARVAALSGDRTILLDCDIIKPMGRQLIREDYLRYGLVEVLLGEVMWHNIVCKDRVTSLDILPMVNALNAYPDLLSGRNMELLLLDLRRSYDFVILDCPYILAASGGLALAKQAGIALLVVQAGRSRSDAVESVLEKLGKAKVEIAGFVLNKVPPEEKIAHPQRRH